MTAVFMSIVKAPIPSFFSPGHTLSESMDLSDVGMTHLMQSFCPSYGRSGVLYLDVYFKQSYASASSAETSQPKGKRKQDSNK
jgi:hypothetical protein